MKLSFYKMFKSNVYNRYKTITDKQNKRIEVLTEIRKTMIFWDLFYFDMPTAKRREFRERTNLPDNDNTSKLFVRLVSPVYENNEKLKILAKEFPLDVK